MAPERVRLWALGLLTVFFLPFVMPFVLGGMLLFVPFMLWYVLWWVAIRLEEWYLRRQLRREYESMLENYRHGG